MLRGVFSAKKTASSALLPELFDPGGELVIRWPVRPLEQAELPKEQRNLDAARLLGMRKFAVAKLAPERFELAKRLIPQEFVIPDSTPLGGLMLPLILPVPFLPLVRLRLDFGEGTGLDDVGHCAGKSPVAVLAPPKGGQEAFIDRVAGLLNDFSVELFTQHFQGLAVILSGELQSPGVLCPGHFERSVRGEGCALTLKIEFVPAKLQLSRRLELACLELADFKGHMVAVVAVFLVKPIRPLLELRTFDLSIQVKPGTFDLQIRFGPEPVKIGGRVQKIAKRLARHGLSLKFS